MAALDKDILDGRYRLISREAAVERLANAKTKEIIQSWTKELRAAARSGRLDASAARKASILARMDKLSTKLLDDLSKIIGAEQLDVYRSELYRTRFMVRSAIKRVDTLRQVSFAEIDNKAIKAAYASNIVGASTTKSFASLSATTRKRMKDDLAEAIANGMSVDELARKWAGGGGAGRLLSDARSLARTSIMAASNNAALTSYKELGKDIVPIVRWEATFDVRTCVVCASRHGNEYAIDKAPPLPAHLNCRCVLIPVFADRKLDTLLNKKQAYIKPNGDVGYRTADRSFEAWLKKQGVEARRDFFPSEFKFQLWRRGTPLEKMVARDGSILTDATLTSRGFRI